MVFDAVAYGRVVGLSVAFKGWCQCPKAVGCATSTENGFAVVRYDGILPIKCCFAAAITQFSDGDERIVEGRKDVCLSGGFGECSWEEGELCGVH